MDHQVHGDLEQESPGMWLLSQLLDLKSNTQGKWRHCGFLPRNHGAECLCSLEGQKADRILLGFRSFKIKNLNKI